MCVGDKCVYRPKKKEKREKKEEKKKKTIRERNIFIRLEEKIMSIEPWYNQIIMTGETVDCVWKPNVKHTKRWGIDTSASQPAQNR